MTIEPMINIPAPRTIRVCLYVAISSAEQNQPKPFSASQRVKRFAAHIADIVSWFVLRRSRARLHHWETMSNTNKGDIAIRETLKPQLREALAPHNIEFTELKWGQLNEHMAARLDRACDLFVIGGSGYIRADVNGELPPNVIEDTKAFAKLRCLKVAYGIGWNSLLDQADTSQNPFNETGRHQLKAFLQTVDLVSVRDRATQTLVRETSGRQAALTGDPALFYSDLFAARPPRPERKKLQIGLNMAMHGKRAAGRVEKMFDKYCEFLTALSHEYDVTFHYVQHSQTECVIPLLLASRGIVVRWHNPPADELSNFYRSLDIHICQMMHSSVLSLGVGVPTMNFGYDIKNRGLFDLMGLSEFYFSSWEFDQEVALAAAGRLIHEGPSLKKQIVSRKEKLRGDLDLFLGDIRGALMCP